MHTLGLADPGSMPGIKQKGLQGRRSMKVIMTSQFQRLVVPTTRFFKKLVIMLAVSSSCLSSDDHVIKW